MVVGGAGLYDVFRTFLGVVNGLPAAVVNSPHNCTLVFPRHDG